MQHEQPFRSGGPNPPLAPFQPGARKFGAFPAPGFISLGVGLTAALGLLGFTGKLCFLDFVFWCVGFWVCFWGVLGWFFWSSIQEGSTDPSTCKRCWVWPLKATLSAVSRPQAAGRFTAAQDRHISWAAAKRNCSCTSKLLSLS